MRTILTPAALGRSAPTRALAGKRGRGAPATAPQASSAPEQPLCPSSVPKVTIAARAARSPHVRLLPHLSQSSALLDTPHPQSTPRSQSTRESVLVRLMHALIVSPTPSLAQRALAASTVHSRDSQTSRAAFPRPRATRAAPALPPRPNAAREATRRARGARAARLARPEASRASRARHRASRARRAFSVLAARWCPSLATAAATRMPPT